MEEMNLNSLKLFLDEDLVLIPSELKEILLAEKLKKQFEGQEEEDEELMDEVEKSMNSKPNPQLLEEEEPAYEEENHELLYEGDFEKGLLVIYQGNQLDKVYREFLLKILGAISYSLKDIALASSDAISSAHPKNIDHLDPHKIIVFGKINHPIAGLNTELYEITTEGEREYLFANDLGAIFEEETLKRKLWNILQVFFNIKK